MRTAQHDFVADHYAPRADDYVTSANHSTGEDLAQIAELVRGHGAAVVLDLGCGGGHVSYAAAPFVAEVVACDITADMLDAVMRVAAEKGLANIRVQQGAAESLPFGDASFDIVLCRFSAHHWQNVQAGLREARRVLKPGGFAVFVDVIAPADPLLDTHLQAVEILRDTSHVRDYSVAEWANFMAASGFSISDMKLRRLVMQFPVWIARTRTPQLNADAVRALQTVAPPGVTAHFDILEDGSFSIDVMTVVVH